MQEIEEECSAQFFNGDPVRIGEMHEKYSRGLLLLAYYRTRSSDAAGTIVQRIFQEVQLRKYAGLAQIAIHGFLKERVRAYSREYIDSNRSAWEAILDQEERQRPGSKRIMMDMIFGDGR